MTKETLLSVQDVRTTLSEGKPILQGVNVDIGKGEVHVLMGPNGSGKSTLANVIMGNPAYQVTGGRIFFEGEDITDARVDQRAKKGIFLAFQSPEEVDGITVSDFLRTAKSAMTDKPMKLFAFKKQLKQTMDTLQLDESYGRRYLNVGFSGGEQKKNEILQMLTLAPKLAILDETDSGLDVDAVRIVTAGVKEYLNRDRGLLVISHSTRLLDELPVDYVHVLYAGRIVHTADRSLIHEINENGFARFIGDK